MIQMPLVEINLTGKYRGTIGLKLEIHGACVSGPAATGLSTSIFHLFDLPVALLALWHGLACLGTVSILWLLQTQNPRGL